MTVRNSFLVAALFILLLVFPVSAMSPKNNHKMKKNITRKSSTIAPALSPQSPPEYVYSNIYDVLSYGAKGDGVTDDTKAFQAAWNDACKSPSSIFEVPAEFTFLVGPISFSGPCQYNLVFQVDGVIVAPTKTSAWDGTSLLQWIQFTRVHHMILQGSGTGQIDGKGPAWWELSCKSQGYRTSKSCDIPTAVRFYGSNNVTVQNLAIVNSPQTHLKFDSCQVVDVNNVFISSPATSPNTDGIHLQDSKQATIRSSTVSSGDDCVSIQTGCSDIDIFDMMCGPGHGISIGGLGKSGTKACVSNVSVRDTVVKDSQNGVRIKTWQGGSGSVRMVSYLNVSVVNVSNPIIIDQFYCDGGNHCQNQTSAVAISDVSYRNIKGTYTQKSSIHFACSDTVPCVKLSVADIDLSPVKAYEAPAFCWNSYGAMHLPTTPEVTCLQHGSPKLGKRVQASSDDGC